MGRIFSSWKRLQDKSANRLDFRSNHDDDLAMMNQVENGIEKSADQATPNQSAKPWPAARMLLDGSGCLVDGLQEVQAETGLAVLVELRRLIEFRFGLRKIACYRRGARRCWESVRLSDRLRRRGSMCQSRQAEAKVKTATALRRLGSSCQKKPAVLMDCTT
jgi:hypothetical protein